MSPTFLRAATLVVSDVDATTKRYIEWFDYRVVEKGIISSSLADFWLSPGSKGKKYSVLQPFSRAPVFLRFVEGTLVETYRTLHTYGWAATEVCVQDVESVNKRMLRSPFQIIGPPEALDGFTTVKPMQVRGPDGEIVYLTEILVDDAPSRGLPVAGALIDRPFIMILACSNLEASIQWVKDVFDLLVSSPIKVKIPLLSAVFNMDLDEKHELCIVKGEGQTFLELDQYPEGATSRPLQTGELPPGVAITSIMFPEFERLSGRWIVPPTTREGVIYDGCKVGLLKTPDGALLEVIDKSTEGIGF